MSIRVYLCGAHSTGKTTLLNDLMPALMQVQAYTNVARDIFHELGKSVSALVNKLVPCA